MSNCIRESKMILHIKYEDVKITERLREAGEILGIPVLDHIILGEGKHFSFQENDM